MLNIFIVFGSLRMNYSLPRKVLLGIISDNETLYGSTYNFEWFSQSRGTFKVRTLSESVPSLMGSLKVLIGSFKVLREMLEPLRVFPEWF